MSRKAMLAVSGVLLLGLTGNVGAALVAHWTFNNSPNDQVGALHWTLNGGATYATDQQEGSHSLLCDGKDDYASLAGSGLMSNAFSAKTIMLWFKPNATLGAQDIYEEGGANQGVAIRINSGVLEAAVRASNVGFTLSTPLSGTGWSHVAISFGSSTFKMYLNGKEVGSVKTSFATVPSHTGAAGLGVRNGGGVFDTSTTTGDYFGGLIDDVQVYDQALTAAEIQAIVGNPALAANASPTDGATDVPQDAALNWAAGEGAAAHDVYFGATFADVNSASRADAKGVLVSQGQAETTFDPPGLLAYGQTYYWRIDEVDKAAGNTVHKGDVWSFTVEPYGLPVKPVAATASSSQVGMGPEKTIDGSGMTGDLHGIVETTMWLSAGGPPNWIQYEFDQVYKLHEMQVWNSNQLVETFLGFGAKSVTMETSTDGTTWTPVTHVPEFARAPGAVGYAANTTVSLGGVDAKFVKLTISANWGGAAPQVGLSEVRFFYVPVQARTPQPAVATTEVSVDATLVWRPGRGVASHKVFLGTDPNAVAQGTAPAQTVTVPSFSPDSLQFGTTYYWRVDEVNTVTYSGEVWSFTTEEFKVVDDFESYTDQAGAEIFSTWTDGYSDKSSGSTVGLTTAINGTFGETTILHGGKQSMPLAYDNTTTPFYSEAMWTFDGPQDWTARGVKSLSLWFQGVAGNSGQLYVKINSTKISYSGDAADVARAAWSVWNIDLSKAGKVNSVRSLTIGIEGAGAKGTLYVDDICLYPKMPEYVTPTAPGATGLQAQYLFDGNANDSSGKGRNGTFEGSPVYAAGKFGQALSLDGVDDAVSITGYKGLVADAGGVQHAFTVCAWIKTVTNSMDIMAWGTDANTQRMNFRVDTVLRVEYGGGNIRGTNGPSLLDDAWHHVAATVPEGGRMMDVRLYVDGRDATPASAATGPFNLQPTVDVTIGRGGALAARFFKGLIDDARIYDRVLSASEIAGLAGLTVPYHKSF